MFLRCYNLFVRVKVNAFKLRERVEFSVTVNAPRKRVFSGGRKIKEGMGILGYILLAQTRIAYVGIASRKEKREATSGH
jgi:hypothetical protein